MKTIVFLLIILLSLTCVQVKTTKSQKPTKQNVVVCFWYIDDLTAKSIENGKKGEYIVRFMPKCDMFALVGMHTSESGIGLHIADKLKAMGSDYECLEGEPKGNLQTRQEQYIACIKKFENSQISKVEYKDTDKDFVTPPTFFLIQYNSIRYLLVPFHSTPKSRYEIRSFKKVVNFAYQNYSDRRTFFGGNFNTGSNYLPENYLNSLDYMVILKQLVPDFTTFDKQKHDLILTDPRTGRKCNGKVWRLDELFPEQENQDEWEKISNHFPVSAECEVY